MTSHVTLDLLLPAIEKLRAEGYVFPMGGGLYVRDDESVDVHLATSADDHFEQTMRAAAPNATMRFHYGQQERHAIFKQ